MFWLRMIGMALALAVGYQATLFGGHCSAYIFAVSISGAFLYPLLAQMDSLDVGVLWAQIGFTVAGNFLAMWHPLNNVQQIAKLFL